MDKINIDYLIPAWVQKFDEKIKPVKQNEGGGLRIKIKQVLNNNLQFNFIPCYSFQEIQNLCVLVDPWAFIPIDDHFCDCTSSVKILIPTDLKNLQWTSALKSKADEFFNHITYNSHYQRCLLQALGYSDLRFLTDPIDTKLFVPLPKQLQVLACGKISCIKNSEFIRDLFVALQGIKEVTTVYIGGSDLWGDVAVSDIVLEQEIRLAADIFLSNIPHHEVAGYMGQASFFVANNIHELYSESHVESLSSGCVSICGGHPVYSERPGFYSKVLTVEQALSALDEYTNGFTTLPQDSLVESSRAWALENASYNAFNHQLQAILSEWF